MEWFTALPSGWLYVVAAGLLAAEVGLPIGLFVPAASIMLATGALAGAGHLDVILAIVATTTGALIGDSVGYWEGRWWGSRARPGRLAARWQRAEELVRTRGGVAITVGRWTPFVRTFVPRLAGAAGMPYRRFLPFNAAGVVIWVPGTVLIGYGAGGPLQHLSAAAAPAAALAAIAIAVIAALAIRRHRTPAAPAAADTLAAQAAPNALARQAATNTRAASAIRARSGRRAAPGPGRDALHAGRSLRSCEG